MVWDWLNWTNALASLPLGIVGFIIAIVQIRQAKDAAKNAQTAAEAAMQAASSAREQFKTVSASSLIPQLIRLEEAVTTAMHQKSLPLLTHVVGNWVWQAGQCRQFLDSGRAEEATIMTNIQKSITAIRALKQELPKLNEQANWIDATSRVRKALSVVTADLGSLAAHQTIKESQ